jgi:hypothetical protein
MRFSPLSKARLAAVLALVLVGCIPLLVSSCRRTEIGTIRITIPEAVTAAQLRSLEISQTIYAGDIDAGHGKSVPIDVLRDLTAAASQGGPANVTRPPTPEDAAPPPVPGEPEPPEPDEPPPPATPAPSAPLPNNTSGTDPPPPLGVLGTLAVPPSPPRE